jgi:hypothetical protein
MSKSGQKCLKPTLVVHDFPSPQSPLLMVDLRVFEQGKQTGRASMAFCQLARPNAANPTYIIGVEPPALTKSQNFGQPPQHTPLLIFTLVCIARRYGLHDDVVLTLLLRLRHGRHLCIHGRLCQNQIPVRDCPPKVTSRIGRVSFNIFMRAISVD